MNQDEPQNPWADTLPPLRLTQLIVAVGALGAIGVGLVAGVGILCWGGWLGLQFIARAGGWQL